jgi:hypothetical protein
MPDHRGKLRTAWKPGQSGNPGGRPKEVIEFNQKVRAKLAEPAAFTKLWKRAEKSDYLMVRLMEYGYGKPPQPIIGESDHPLEVIVKYADR